MDTYSSKLGGNGVVVHFDETPITHRHAGIGRSSSSNTVWVVGGVDIYTRKCSLKFLPSRSRSDLFLFLNEWILPGSVVHTDCHRSYHTLSSLGFTHFSVNHSRHLVDENGINTNWIEGIFGCVKKR
jgi:transposase-like protein